MFLIMTVTVPWVNMLVFLFLLNHYADSELLYLLDYNSSQAYNNYYRASLLAFFVAYLIAKQLINKRVMKKIWRAVWYVITYVISFLLILISPI